MAEEHSFQAPEGHRLCANNCGFFGSPTTMNLCSKCFGELSIKKSTVENPLPSPPSPLSSSSSSSSSPSPSLSSSSTSSSSSSTPPLSSVSLSSSSGPEIAIRSLSPVPKLPSVTGESEDRSGGSRPSRCAACRKRVGLTGFKCRCGTTFCGSHRYPEQHGCGFDFKGIGREEIARANPVVKAEKLDNKI